MWPRDSAGVWLLADLHPAPPAPLPDGSLVGWVWLMIVVAVLVAGAVVLGSRR
jgi:hypothetical protein